VFDVADPKAESVTFTATDSTDALTLSKTATVSFQTPAVSPTKSSMTLSATTGPADGITDATIEVTLDDQFGDVIPGKAISVSGGTSTTVRITPEQGATSVVAGTTDATGEALFFATDTTAEVVTFTATDTTDNVTFSNTVQFTYQPTLPQSNQSSIAAQPTLVAANGTAASTITVTLDDHNANPVSGKSVSLTALNGSSAISPATAPTNSAGVATFAVTDATAETVTYEATDTSDNLPLAGQSAIVTFGTKLPAHLPDPSFSSVVADSGSVPADGQTTATIDVDLSDANGQPLAGKAVVLMPSGGSSEITAVNSTTDATGTASFTVSDATPESVTYTANDVSDSFLVTGQSATVIFTPAPVITTTTTTTTTTTLPATTTTTTIPVATAAAATSGKFKATERATARASAKVTTPAAASATAKVTASATERGASLALAKEAAKAAARSKATDEAAARAHAKAEAKARALAKKGGLTAKSEEKTKPEAIVGSVAPPDHGGDEGA
jgi:hypothetical protein